MAEWVSQPRAHLVVRRPALGWLLKGLERAAALAGLVLIAPALLMIVVAIKLDSRGPVLFRQTRVGQYGRTFTIYKFRTMRVGADAELAALLAEQQTEMTAFVKLDHDPRITRLGAFLRATSLDELPQLLNVVQGTMALVGPRPQTPAEAAVYGTADWRRLLMRPGITGLWQVSGRSELSVEESLLLDERYVREWTPGLDIRLLFRTVGAVLQRVGAR